MKKLIAACVLICLLKLSAQQHTNNPPQPPVPILNFTNNATNSIEIGCSDNPVIFYFNTSTNAHDFWAQYGELDILYTTNLSLPRDQWSVHSNVQMNALGIWVGCFSTNNCFFQIRLRSTNT